jgi:hypothetical protein
VDSTRILAVITITPSKTAVAVVVVNPQPLEVSVLAL